MEVTRRRWRRHKKLLDDLKDKRGYSHLKEESLDRTMRRNRFAGGFGPVVRRNTEWMNEWMNEYIYIYIVVIHQQIRNPVTLYSSYPCIDNTILRKSPTNALYMLTPLYSHLNTGLDPVGALLSECWYILWAGSTKYLSRCKYQIKE